MYIKRDHSIRQIQEEFNTRYPGLSIRLYSRSHDEQEGSMGEYELDLDTMVSEVNPSIREGDIKLQDDQSVAEVERLFFERFGLSIQIFRRSADLWLQTIATDHWSLEKQNRKGISSVEKTGGTLES